MLVLHMEASGGVKELVQGDPPAVRLLGHRVTEGFLAPFVPSEAARLLRPPQTGRVLLPAGVALPCEHVDL